MGAGVGVVVVTLIYESGSDWVFKGVLSFVGGAGEN